MASELIAGLSIFKTLYDSAKALKDINDTAVRNTAVIELQEKILAARETQSALLERVGELEKEVAGFKAWEAEKEKYKLTEVGSGLLAYALKEEGGSSAPKHLLCANCFEHGHKSYLQQETRFPGRTETLACHECGSDLYVQGSPHPDHFKGRQTTRRR